MRYHYLIGISLLAVVMATAPAMAQNVRYTSFEASEGWTTHSYTASWTNDLLNGDQWIGDNDPSGNPANFGSIVNSGGPGTGHTGTQYVYLRRSAIVAMNFDVTAPATGLTMDLWGALSVSTAGPVWIDYSNDGGASWGGAIWANQFSVFCTSNNTWYAHPGATYAASGAVRFRFRRAGGGATDTRYDWIDDVSIDQVPAVEDWALY